MKKIYTILLICTLFAFLYTGCGTIKENTTEDKATQAAEWVKTRSGFIQNAVSAIVRVSVYSSEKDTLERTRTLEILHSIGENLNNLINSGQVDSENIANALRIEEPYFGPIMNAVASIIQVEMTNFKNNGYADLSIEILKAVSAGLRDGSAT